MDAVVVTGITTEKLVQSSAPLFDLSKQETRRLLVVEGKLVGADAESRRDNRITIIEDNLDKRVIVVPKGMMNDVVRPFFNRRIRAEVVTRGDAMRLLGVQEASDE